MVDIKEYMKMVRVTKGNLNKEILKGHPALAHREMFKGEALHTMQPIEFELVVNEETQEDFPWARYCYVTSINNRQAGTTGGSTTIVTLAHAARLLVDATHKLSSTDEIKECLRKQIANKREADAGDRKLPQPQGIAVSVTPMPVHLAEFEKAAKKAAAV